MDRWKADKTGKGTMGGGVLRGQRVLKGSGGSGRGGEMGDRGVSKA